MAWKVTYDPTTFVTDTIHEVQKTLVEAFVLVVIVVFLFLDSVRATLIPTFAVPVSLIGTFVTLLAVGYSANTVSLLAIVLAMRASSSRFSLVFPSHRTKKACRSA
jgi:multidrug efflux pump subunit AcrB